LDVDHTDDFKYAKSVTWTSLKKDGSFSFDKKHLSDKDAAYRIYVNRVEEPLRDAIAGGELFYYRIILTRLLEAFLEENEIEKTKTGIELPIKNISIEF